MTTINPVRNYKPAGYRYRLWAAVIPVLLIAALVAVVSYKTGWSPKVVAMAVWLPVFGWAVGGGR